MQIHMRNLGTRLVHQHGPRFKSQEGKRELERVAEICNSE